MKTIRVNVSTGYQGSYKEDEFKVEDDATVEEIHELALETLFCMIDWGYEIVDKADES